jgi:hypothetical protein
MALSLPGYVPIPQYESSLASLMPAFDAGRKERADANAFDAAAKAFGGNASTPTPAQPQTALERLVGMFTGQTQPQTPQASPRPPANAVAAIDAAAPAYPPLAPRPGDQIATSDTSNIPQGSNAARAVQYFINKGYSTHQAAGIVGNLMQESGPDLNVAAVNPGDGADGSDSVGIAQWNGERARALRAYAAQNGGDVSQLDTQLGFIDHELNTTEGAARQALMQAQDPIQAAAAFAGYERPAGWTPDNPYGAHSWGSRAQNAAALAGSEYAPPGSPIGWNQPEGAKPFQVDEQTMRAMLASEATRPLAISLIQAQQETQASQGRYLTEEGPDGSIWQRDTLTGQRNVLQEPQAPAQRRIVQGPDGNSYYEDGTRVLPGVEAPAAAPTPPKLETIFDPTTGREQTVQWDGSAWQPVGGVEAPGSPLVEVNNGQEPALDKALNEAEGKTWSGFKDSAAVSASNAQDFEILGELLTLAPQGPITGRLADTFKGFSAAGDAANSIIKRIAPTLRAPGSGATSDIEYNGMLQSLPSLAQNPEANAMVLAIMQAKAQINMERGRIVTAYQNGEMTIAEARAAMDDLNAQSIMTPEMKRSLLGLGSDGNVGIEPPAVGDEVEGYIYNGGDPSSPSSWSQVN